jgi:hypothetical protein
MTRLSRAAFAVGVAAFLLAPAAPQTLHAQAAVARYSALAVDMGGPVGRSSTTVNITVNRWSTDADRQKLVDTLLEKGPEHLLDTLQNMPRIGSISATGSVGFDVRYARRTPLAAGGARIVLVTDRPITFREAWVHDRSMDYPFTLVEMHLDRNGKGEGKLSLATKIIVDRDTKAVTLENYTVQPVLLTAVTRLSPAEK